MARLVAPGVPVRRPAVSTTVEPCGIPARSRAAASRSRDSRAAAPRARPPSPPTTRRSRTTASCVPATNRT